MVIVAKKISDSSEVLNGYIIFHQVDVDWFIEYSIYSVCAFIWV